MFSIVLIETLDGIFIAETFNIKDFLNSVVPPFEY